MTRVKKRKKCPRCGVIKRLVKGNFVYTTRADGKRLWKHCRVCESKRQRVVRAEVMADPERAKRQREKKRVSQNRRYAKDPERHQAQQREYRARLKADDPERYIEVFLVSRRFRQEGRTINAANHTQHEPFVGLSARDVVPIDPLRDYLLSTFPGYDVEELHSVLGDAVSTRLMSAVLSRRTNVISLDAADRVLTRGLARPDLLNTLYPYEGKSL